MIIWLILSTLIGYFVSWPLAFCFLLAYIVFQRFCIATQAAVVRAQSSLVQKLRAEMNRRPR